MKIYQTENHRLCQFGAVGSGVGSPKGLGTADDKPLMQNPRGPVEAHRDGNTAPNIFWQPIGTVPDLGALRLWTGDVIAVLAVLAGLIVLGLFLL